MAPERTVHHVLLFFVAGQEPPEPTLRVLEALWEIQTDTAEEPKVAPERSLPQFLLLELKIAYFQEPSFGGLSGENPIPAEQGFFFALIQGRGRGKMKRV